ncbi:hypothetical protein LJC30_01835 [Odoribacter sp. OttesenSCG-928-L07]|nr:hypothetical protein [Odoribacter sp. OttesenSCG-928-L07]MDL2238907.1 hypothetical protein [Bacteroidales bacterium OttesenSCG-928-L14]
MKETFENSKKIEHSVFFPYVGMRIYPKTKLCEIAIKEGIITNVDELINPIYYVAKSVDINKLEMMANETGKKWIFPNSEVDPMMCKLRQRGRKGPLWEYLRY